MKSDRNDESKSLVAAIPALPRSNAVGTLSRHYGPLMKIAECGRRRPQPQAWTNPVVYREMLMKHVPTPARLAGASTSSPRIFVSAFALNVIRGLGGGAGGRAADRIPTSESAESGGGAVKRIRLGCGKGAGAARARGRAQRLRPRLRAVHPQARGAREGGRGLACGRRSPARLLAHTPAKQ